MAARPHTQSAAAAPLPLPFRPCTPRLPSLSHAHRRAPSHKHAEQKKLKENRLIFYEIVLCIVFIFLTLSWRRVWTYRGGPLRGGQFGRVLSAGPPCRLLAPTHTNRRTDGRTGKGGTGRRAGRQGARGSSAVHRFAVLFRHAVLPPLMNHLVDCQQSTCLAGRCATLRHAAVLIARAEFPIAVFLSFFSPRRLCC